MRPIRILIIEDDNDRLARLKAMLPEWTRPVAAVSAGRAIGLLERDSSRKNGGRDTYAGILLDHDLVCHAVNFTDSSLDGRDVTRSIVQNVTSNVPVLVHSMNFTHSQTMVSWLEGEGFPVSRIPMSLMTKDKMAVWLEEVMELWEDREE
ncbi:MAG: hypothetical protein HZB31_04355 [Nitrospirae bacterium]|nr:hypothetical protein [Nitrospirota bacterium]